MIKQMSMISEFIESKSNGEQIGTISECNVTTNSSKIKEVLIQRKGNCTQLHYQNTVYIVTIYTNTCNYRLHHTPTLTSISLLTLMSSWNLNLDSAGVRVRVSATGDALCWRALMHLLWGGVPRGVWHATFQGLLFQLPAQEEVWTIPARQVLIIIYQCIPARYISTVVVFPLDIDWWIPAKYSMMHYRWIPTYVFSIDFYWCILARYLLMNIR